ncbi:hypothetical protein L6164_018839 [Bauhinia variegata]|uniref:Uncharacterized protein n=1 Tax=Bauhinia variegata TaxID=167791 RepID=A0ACB9NCA7_BAUVA|nr:hypothetical protein L6164_018839 [Bauhinia variegata]
MSMDRSLNSSMGKAHMSANEKLTCAQDSGWTAYFEDLSNNMEDGSSYSLGGSSMVSDAASCAAWKFSHSNHAVSPPNPPKKLSFKKKRTKHILKDDPLEDTASSPVNSPKGKGFTSDDYSELPTDDHKNLYCTDLKKRGLCLVPLSMLVNYFG